MFPRLTLAILLLGVLSGSVVAMDELAEGFRAPPQETRRRVCWWWLNNLVSREGMYRRFRRLLGKDAADDGRRDMVAGKGGSQ